MKILIAFSLGLSLLGIIAALPFILHWWDWIIILSETFPLSEFAFWGFLTGFSLEIIAFCLAAAAIIVAIRAKRRNPAYLIPKLLLALPFIVNILGFGIFLATLIKIIIMAGGAVK